MTDLRTKIELAALAACNTDNGPKCEKLCSACMGGALAFLRALESEGLKVLDGETTEEMIDAGVENNRTSWNEGVDWEFPREVAVEIFIGMLAAAPTLADRLKEEK